MPPLFNSSVRGCQIEMDFVVFGHDILKKICYTIPSFLEVTPCFASAAHGTSRALTGLNYYKNIEKGYYDINGNWVSDEKMTPTGNQLSLEPCIVYKIQF